MLWEEGVSRTSSSAQFPEDVEISGYVGTDVSVSEEAIDDDAVTIGFDGIVKVGMHRSHH